MQESWLVTDDTWYQASTVWVVSWASEQEPTFITCSITIIGLYCPCTDPMIFGCIIKCPGIRLPINVTLPCPCIFITGKLCVTFSELEFLNCHSTIFFVFWHLCGLLHYVSFVYFALPASLSAYTASSNSIVKSCCLVYCLCYVFMFLLLFGMSLVFYSLWICLKPTSVCQSMQNFGQFNIPILCHLVTVPWGLPR